MIIEHEKMLGVWIVWLKIRSAKFEMFRSKTKKECKAWLEARGKK